jgi:hypothetical protein
MSDSGRSAAGKPSEGTETGSTAAGSSPAGRGGDEPLTPWELTRKRYEASYVIEREDRKVEEENGGKDDQAILLRMRSFLRDKRVAASWDPVHRVDHPLSGLYWQRVTTQQDGRPPMPPVSQHVICLDLAECLTGDLEKLGPLLSKLSHLRVLRLNGNKTLTGDLAKIEGKELPNLESVNLMGTGIHTMRGLTMFASCKKMKNISIMGLGRVKGAVPEGLVKLPGLHLDLEGSGVSGQDPVGNRKRAALRFARSAVPKAPNGPFTERPPRANAEPLPMPSQIELGDSYAKAPWHHPGGAPSRRGGGLPASRRKGPPIPSPEFRSPPKSSALVKPKS